MPRRLAVAAIVAASLLPLTTPSSAADAFKPQLPLAQCDQRVTDDPDDGIVNWNPTTTGDRIKDPRGTVTSLDITGITIRVTATRVMAFMQLKDISEDWRPTDTAYGYYMWFTKGSKIARFQVIYANPQQSAIAPTGYPTASVGTSTNGGTSQMKGLGGGIDTSRNVAYVYADRASLEQQLGEPLTNGSQLTAINGRTVMFIAQGTVGPLERDADTASATGDKATYTVGKDPCFPSSIVYTDDVTASYGDAATLTATLVDSDDIPLDNRTVSFQVPGEASPRTLTTDEEGNVSVTIPAVAASAGRYDYTVTYAGDDTSGPATDHGTLVVKAEGTKFAPLKVTKAGTSRLVTATLSEDDPRPFAKAPIDFYVNGKKVKTVVADAQGRASYKVPAGSKVQARYAGVPGKYAPATSNTVTA